MLTLDHLVVVAPDLAEGVAHVRDCLGLAMPEGGRHEAMGTRNHLLRLGDALFLEVIAVDPEAPAPPRARWFGLSDSQALDVFPNLGNFDVAKRNLGFMTS